MVVSVAGWTIPEPTKSDPFSQLTWLVNACSESYDNPESRTQFAEFKSVLIDFATWRYGFVPFKTAERLTPLSLLHFHHYLRERRSPGHDRYITSKSAETFNDRFRKICDYAYGTAELIDEPVIPIPYYRDSTTLETDRNTAFSIERLDAIVTVIRRMVRETERFLIPYVPTGMGIDPRGPGGRWRDWENVVWYFENILDCNPYLRRGRERAPFPGFSYFASNSWWGNHRRIYEKLGVLAYVNRRQLFPLVFDLALETGLNFEALKCLEVDSYAARHPLTGRPYLAYSKTRSGGAKDLNLSIAEDPELVGDLSSADSSSVLWPGEGRARRIEKIVATALKLTAVTRARLPIDDPRRRHLFLYEVVNQGGRGAVGGQVRSLNDKDGDGSFHRWVQRVLKPAVIDESTSLMTRTTKPTQWKRQAKRIADEITVESFSIRKVRATVATQLVRKGAPIEAIQVFLGHKNLWTTLCYIDRHALDLRFNRDMTKYLGQIKDNAAQYRKSPLPVATQSNDSPGQHIFECGITHCRNPFDPPENIKQSRDYTPGRACTQWNKCLFCRHVVITPFSLPKVLALQANIETTLKQELHLPEPKVNLLLRLRSVIADLLETDIFTEEEIARARMAAELYVEQELDALLINGIRSWA
jgi:hypothetical protein